MMKIFIKVRVSVSILFLIVFLSCKNKSTHQNGENFAQGFKPGTTELNDSIIHIDLDAIEMYESINYSRVFSGVKYLPLETNLNCNIGNVSKIVVANDLIYILDKYSAKSLFIFDLKGNFMRKITAKGKGPGEFLVPLDFTIDQSNNKILILDSQNKILIYSAMGEFERETRLKRMGICNSIASNNNCIYLSLTGPFYSKWDYLLYSVDKNGKYEHAWFSNKIYGLDFLKPISLADNLVSGKNEIKFSKNFFDTIFCIRNETVTPFMVMHTKDKITAEEIKEINEHRSKDKSEELHDSGDMISKLRKYAGITNYLEDSNMIYFKFNFRTGTCKLFYNKNDNKILCSQRFYDDLSGRSKFILFNCTYNNSFVSHIFNGYNDNFETLISNVKNGSIKVTAEEQKKILKLNEQSNPVLVFYETKE